MSISLPEGKRQKIIAKCKKFSLMTYCLIQDLAELLGLLISSLPAVPYGMLYTKILEREKYLALQRNDKNYFAKITASPPLEDTFIDGRSFVQQAYTRKGFTEETVNLILNSITTSSWRQYQPTLLKWQGFCRKRNVSPFEFNVQLTSDFLLQLFNSNVGYGSINTARSALSLFLTDSNDNTIGSHSSISRLLKGVSKLRPTNPRYNTTWSPDQLLNYLQSLYPLENLSLQDLAMKTVALLALATAQRVQTITLIKLSEICCLDDVIKIFISSATKTSRPGAPQPCLLIPYNKTSPQICVASTLEHYISRTKPIRSDITNLFVSCTKPYRPVCSQTISRWIKTALGKAGIDVNLYKAHSVRHSATSAANRGGLTVEQILSHVGWSKNSTTFARFYNRPLDSSSDFPLSVFGSFNT
ncbi:Tyrosine recombinase XerD [Orchesella cincta]|uniref:Tyrosine recombinase XerD n=1 Tax=Orchesella cincta TaxID=48709 RepID=A0A1D2M470_ORCCI|nr:Tyrosine recombinase XerD [Orchesella cincta]